MPDRHDSEQILAGTQQAGLIRSRPNIGDVYLQFSTACRQTLRRTVLSTVAIGMIALGFGLGESSAVAAGIATARAAPMTAFAAWPTPRLTKMVAEAKRQTTLAISYSYGGGHGARPAPVGSHVDCSGFVREMYSYGFGVDIGNGSGDGMVRLSGKFVKTSHPVVGDVALFGTGGRGPAYHSGIYIGMLANGHPGIVASPSTGSNIKVQQWFDRYWHADLMGYWHYRGATAADSGPLNGPTRGRYEKASGARRAFTISGWALDPAKSSASNTVRITVDGRAAGDFRTSGVRSDVNRIYKIVGKHGFSVRLGARAGRHKICVSALPTSHGAQPVSLGCKVATVNA